MDAKASRGDKHSKILQDTLQHISSAAAGANAKYCVICLGELAEPCEARPCRHSDFDYLCLITWLENRATCPLCKCDVSEVGYDFDEDGQLRKVFKVPELCRDRVEDGRPRMALPSGNRSSRQPGRLTRPWSLEDTAIRRRRLVYRHRLYSLHVGSNNRQPAGSRYQELSPQLISSTPELLSRARMWLRRELCVFRFLYDVDRNDYDPSPQDREAARRPRLCKAEFLLEYIIAILKSIDTQGNAGQAEDMIQEFLGRENTRLFLHELRAWLRSSCKTLTEWDRTVQYRDPNMRLSSRPRREEVGDSDGDLEQRAPVCVGALNPTHVVAARPTRNAVAPAGG